MKKSKSFFAILFLINLFTYQVSAQPGTLDVTFDGDGKATTDFGGTGDGIINMVLQPDGKFVVTGNSTLGSYTPFATARYLSNGSIDSTFNNTGYAYIDFPPYTSASLCIALQADGKMIVGGRSAMGMFGLDAQFTLVRYLTDGTPDSTFDSDGVAMASINVNNDWVNALAIQPDGKIVAGGQCYSANFDFAVVRFLPDGALDTTFSNDGMVVTSFGNSNEIINSILLQPDGKIVAAGTGSFSGLSDFAIVRYLSDGTLDSSFNGTGIATYDFNTGNDYIRSVALQPDGKIIATGPTNTGTGTKYKVGLIRINTDGTLDTTFSNDGKLISDFSPGFDDISFSALLQTDGKIIMAGSSESATKTDFLLARYDANGALDSSFSAGGKRIITFGTGTDAATSAVLQPDGKVVAGGRAHNGLDSDFALARYIPGISTGINDMEVSENISIYPNPAGKIVHIKYSLLLEEPVSIDLYDLQGRKIKCIVDHKNQSAGEHHEQIALPDDLNKGIYLICLSTAEERKTIKLVK